jgi:DNA-binding MarR family transcriptional regulator
VSEPYYNIVKLIERLHRQFLDVLRNELRRLGIEDINAVQALLLYNIGEDDVVIRDLKDRGYCHGTNVSYNIKSLTQAGYLVQEGDQHDRRAMRLKLSDKGIALCQAIRQMQQVLAKKAASQDATRNLSAADSSLQALERLWTDYMRYGR